jgi:hypothetical protein
MQIIITIMTIRMVLIGTNNHPKEIIIDPSFTNPCLKAYMIN